MITYAFIIMNSHTCSFFNPSTNEHCYIQSHIQGNYGSKKTWQIISIINYKMYILNDIVIIARITYINYIISICILILYYNVMILMSLLSILLLISYNVQ